MKILLLMLLFLSSSLFGDTFAELGKKESTPGAAKSNAKERESTLEEVIKEKSPQFSSEKLTTSSLGKRIYSHLRGRTLPEASETTKKTIDTNEDPIQITTKKKPFSLERGRYKFTIKPLAAYEIHAQVKSRRTYDTDWTSLLSSIDLALAWGGLVSKIADKHIKYSQKKRWYYYNYDGGSPYYKPYIRSHSSNHHILHANANVEKAVHSLKVKDKVRLKGYLVRVDGKSRFNERVWWKSSMTREDEGDGACEVLWVKEVQIGDKIYK